MMFSNLPNPSDMCGLGACHSAFRQVTGIDATLMTPHYSPHLAYLAIAI